jgi:hypothetical protein
VPPVIGIVVIDPASVMALTITGAADINSYAVRANVHTLGQSWRRGSGSHGTSEAERD